MKIQEVIFEAKAHDMDDMDEPVGDPDQDKTPHIFMQLRKAVDVEGNYPISFKDGKRVKLSMDDISAFVKKYVSAKPDEKDELQAKASNSYDDFMSVIKAPDKPKFQHKIKGDRYMSHFAGDLDDK